MYRKLAAACVTAACVTLLTPGAAHAAPHDVTPQDIDAYATEALDATGVPGLSVVVTHDDEPVHAAGYGEDSRGESLTSKSPMRVASLSKSFTAMAVMILVEDGEIELDEPVAKQLPEFDLADPRGDEVTVRQLLDQTSGLSDSSIDIVDLDSATSLADYVARMDDDRLAADPGTAWSYCNANFEVAARVVEHVAGTDFNTFMKREVFEPLDMDHSTVRESEGEPPQGYNSIYNMWASRVEPALGLDSGAGGVITDAIDMGKWLITQQGEKEQLVGPDSMAAMHSPSKVENYGFGWQVRGDRLVHSGNLLTYNAVQMIDTKTGYAVAVMANGASLADPTYSIGAGLLALTENETPGGIETDYVFQLILTGVTLLALGLGLVGVLRGRRWAAKRAGRPAWRVALRLSPLAVPIVLFAILPDLTSYVTGRTVTWALMTYFPAPLTLTLAAAALAAAATLLVRLVRLSRARRAPAAG